MRIVLHYLWKVLLCMKSENYYAWIILTYTSKVKLGIHG